MKINHTRHKVGKAFPLTLRWSCERVYILGSGTIFRYIVSDSCIVHDEQELWNTKHHVESQKEFKYWDIDWEEIEDKLDDN
jgi:hypothetical protein